MLSFLWVFLGGGLGSVSRYAIHLGFGSQTFYQALVPNILGCFLIGLFTSSALSGQDEFFKQLLVIGFLGGFTTFSSYVGFIGQSGFYTPTVIVYFLLNNVLGVLFYLVGTKLI